MCWASTINAYDAFAKSSALLGTASHCLSILKISHCQLDYEVLMATGRAMPQLEARSLPTAPFHRLTLNTINNLLSTILAKKRPLQGIPVRAILLSLRIFWPCMQCKGLCIGALQKS